MKDKDKILNLVYCRFPINKDRIVELFEESESFRELCEEFYECRKMIETLIGISNKNKAICNEYEILLAEIDNEISERISG